MMMSEALIRTVQGAAVADAAMHESTKAMKAKRIIDMRGLTFCPFLKAHRDERRGVVA